MTTNVPDAPSLITPLISKVRTSFLARDGQAITAPNDGIGPDVRVVNGIDEVSEEIVSQAIPDDTTALSYMAELVTMGIEPMPSAHGFAQEYLVEVLSSWRMMAVVFTSRYITMKLEGEPAVHAKCEALFREAMEQTTEFRG